MSVGFQRSPVGRSNRKDDEIMTAPGGPRRVLGGSLREVLGVVLGGA